MTAASPPRVPGLFPVPVIRGLLRRAIKQMSGEDARSTLEKWKGATLGRFAAWVAAVEGAVDVLPEILELLALVTAEGTSGTYADFQGPLDALQGIVEKGEHDALTRHRASRVRLLLAGMDAYRAALKGDPEPTVRHQARYRYAGPACEPPWWKGVLPVAPPELPEVLAFGNVAPKLRQWNDWSGANELAEALRKLPRDLAGRIAPQFVPSMWCPEVWVDAVWEALVQAPSPLAERVVEVEAAVEALRSAGACVEPVHGPAITRAVEGCPAGEREAFLPFVERVRAALETPERHEQNAAWSPAPRVARRSRGAAVRSCPPTLFERLVAEIVAPGPWGASRFSQHPRARFELGRGLEALQARSSALHDATATAERLADIVATCVERRPSHAAAILLALAGLLRALDLDDPLFPELARHASPAVREALALSAIGGDGRHVAPLLEAPEPEVWMAARMALPTLEPWRGLLPSDPFEGCLPDEAAALVPVILDLDRALPRVRHETLEKDDFVPVGRAAARLPGRLTCELARRILPEDHLHKRMALLAAALLAAEGGWSVWVSEVERRVAKHADLGRWFGGALVVFAVQEASSPSDGGPPLPWPPSLRRAAARDALARSTRRGVPEQTAEMWLDAAVALWLDDDDPLPLPGPWRFEYPPYSVSARLQTLHFRPEWEATRVLMDGARGGFASPWSFWHGVDKVLDRLPTEMRLDAALEGFWRDEAFGKWSRAELGEAIAAARAEGPAALAERLGDARLAPENLVDRGRIDHTLFVLRARLEAGLADLAEALLTLSRVALDPEVPRWTEGELAAWRSLWGDAIQAAMAQGPGGLRGALVTLAPPGLWEPIDRSFVHAVASDATLEEAQAVARRLAACGDAEDLPVVHDLAGRHPAAAPWSRLVATLDRRGAAAV